MQSNSSFFTAVCTVVPALLIAAAVGERVLANGFEVLDGIKFGRADHSKRGPNRVSWTWKLALGSFFLLAVLALGASLLGLAYPGSQNMWKLAALIAGLPFILLFGLYAGVGLWKPMRNLNVSGEDGSPSEEDGQNQRTCLPVEGELQREQHNPT